MWVEEALFYIFLFVKSLQNMIVFDISRLEIFCLKMKAGMSWMLKIGVAPNHILGMGVLIHTVRCGVPRYLRGVKGRLSRGRRTWDAHIRRDRPTTSDVQTGGYQINICLESGCHCTEDQK